MLFGVCAWLIWFWCLWGLFKLRLLVHLFVCLCFVVRCLLSVFGFASAVFFLGLFKALCS